MSEQKLKLKLPLKGVAIANKVLENKKPGLSSKHKTEEQIKKEKKKENNAKRKEYSKFFLERYPNCFSFEAPKPLAIDIHEQIVIDCKKNRLKIGEDRINIKQVIFFLSYYVRQKEYLETLKFRAPRFDMRGFQRGYVNRGHAKHALKKLEELKEIIKPKSKKKEKKNVRPPY